MVKGTTTDRQGDDRHFMLQALRLAFDNMAIPSPNPSVGAVIVSKGEVVAKGATEAQGKRHAEIVAIQNAPAGALNGSTLYVSLEPCSHYGKTPPCTDAIIAAGISRVVIPIVDPNPAVSGNGIRRLVEAGIDVAILEEMMPHANDLIRPFKKSILRKVPFVIHKVASTLDGRTAADSGHSQWISSNGSRRLAHRLRSRCDAVLVGKNTFCLDRPRLSVRLDDFADTDDSEWAMTGYDNFFMRSLLDRDFVHLRQPLRVVLGIPESLDENDPFLEHDNYLFCESSRNFEKWRKLAPDNLARSLKVAVVDAPADEFISALCRDLYGRGVMTLMLEGGSRVAGSFHDAGCIDQYVYSIAPRIAGSGYPVLRGKALDSMNDALTLHDVSWVTIGRDMVLSGYREVYNFEMM